MKQLVQIAFFAMAIASSPIFGHGDDDSHGAVIGKPGDPGKVDFACLQPGHFEAGMKGRITVK